MEGEELGCCVEESVCEMQRELHATDDKTGRVEINVVTADCLRARKCSVWRKRSTAR